MRQIQVGSEKETVVERADYPPERLRAILDNEVVAVVGYGVQGRSQSLNMKDNGVKVIVGQREKTRSWDLAMQDGWVPGQSLFPLEEACKRGTIIQYLLSDAGQKEQWPRLKPYLTAGKALYFSKVRTCIRSVTVISVAVCRAVQTAAARSFNATCQRRQDSHIASSCVSNSTRPGGTHR